MPPPRKPSPGRRERRTRSRSYSPRPSYGSRRRSRSRSPRDTRDRRQSRSPEWKRSSPRRSFRERSRSRSPRYVARRSPQRRSPAKRSRSPPRQSGSLSYERRHSVERAPADSTGKRVSSTYRSRSPSPVPVKRLRDERDHREDGRRDDSRREESRRYSPSHRSQERGHSPDRRSPSPQYSRRRDSPFTGKMYADKPSSSRAPLFPVGRKKEEISSVTIVNKARLEKLDKRFQTLEQISRGSFDFEDNITIGIHRGPQHVSLDEDIPVNYNFNPKSFYMLHSQKETHKGIFDRDEILQFHHDDILDEEAYVEKRTITVQPAEKSKSKWRDTVEWRDTVDYKITVGRSSREEEYSGDRRMVRDSGRRRSSRDPEVTVRLDPKPDPRYEKLFRDSQRRSDRRSRSRSREPRDPHDLRHNLNKRHRDSYEGEEDRGIMDARRKIEARRSDRGGSLDRQGDIRITKVERKERRKSQERLRKERGRASLDKELPDFKNRPVRSRSAVKSKSPKPEEHRFLDRLDTSLPAVRTTKVNEQEKFNFESWKIKPEITPKGASYYLHDERSRDDMTYWERKQYFLATGQSPRPGPSVRGRGRGTSRPFRGRGRSFSFSRGAFSPGFRPGRDTTTENEWKHDKFSEINKETDKDSNKESDKDRKKKPKEKGKLDKKSRDKDKSDRKREDKKNKSKSSKGKTTSERKTDKERDKERDKKSDKKPDDEKKTDKEKTAEKKATKDDKGKSKSIDDKKEKDTDLETGNIGPNFSNLLTLT